MLGQILSNETFDQLVKKTLSTEKEENPWIIFDPNLMKSAYNKHPFIVPHRLEDHPLFTIDSLFTLCRRLNEPHVKVRFGNIPKDVNFDTSLDEYKKELTLEDALMAFEEKKAYIVINNPERDPTYRVVIEELLGEIAVQLKNLNETINWYSTYIFISTEGSVTPYHMDREMNFLLQIKGNKIVKLWDPLDPEIMTDSQKDALLAYSGNRPEYHSAFDRKALVYDLNPGLGVHHPFIAPHLVTTLDGVAISLAITFRTHQSDTWTFAHTLNHKLRKLGWSPTAVACYPWLDKMKSRFYKFALKTKKILKR